MFLEDHLKELNSALTKRDETIEELKRRLLEMEAGGQKLPRENEKEAPLVDKMEMSLLVRENEDLKGEVDQMSEKEKELIEQIRRLKQQNSDLSEVLNPMKQDKNKFYQKFFDQEKKIEMLENKVTSLLDDNTNLKKILEQKNEGKQSSNW